MQNQSYRTHNVPLTEANFGPLFKMSYNVKMRRRRQRAAAAGCCVWISWVVWRGFWSDEPLIEEEVGLAALDFTFAHRLNARVADVEPGPSRCLCVSCRGSWSERTHSEGGTTWFKSYSGAHPTLSQSVWWGMGTTWSYFNIGRVVTRPHCSTVLHNAIQTVQDLSLSLRQDLFSEQPFLVNQWNTHRKKKSCSSFQLMKSVMANIYRAFNSTIGSEIQ